MPRTIQELEAAKRFAGVYDRSRQPVMQAIERSVCGCDYGGNSWTTQAEADDLIRRLQLRPGIRLLDLGAGSGWPALYYVRRSGCEAVLVDIPENGLQIAEERAARQGQSHLVSTLVADAAELPFPNRCFDVITHSDLLCCLIQKRSVLGCCRRVVRDQGHMAFTVISIAPGLSPEQQARALINGPEFVKSDTDYRTLLAQTGWELIDNSDLTSAYAASCQRQIQADETHRRELAALIGDDACTDRIKGWRDKHSAIKDGLFRRELFLARPKRV